MAVPISVVIIPVAIVALLGVVWWWRHRSLACPAGATWLLENPLMNAIAGPQLIFSRIGLQRGMRLLDVGCGPGRLTIPAAQQVGEEGEVTALDIQPRMLQKLHTRIAAQALHNIHPILGGAGCGLLERDHYDRVLLVTVLGEIRQRETALQEIFAALKPGGLLSVTEVLCDPHYVGKRRLAALCEAVGFREVETFSGPLSYTRNYLRPG